MSVKCLMLETPDRKRFFLPLGCRSALGDYCKAFGARTEIVRADLKRSQLTKLSGFASAVCDKSYRTPRVSFRQQGQKNSRITKR